MRKQKLRSIGNTEQAEAQEKAYLVLSEISVRMQTIEPRMEVQHMQPPPVTKKEEVNASLYLNSLCALSKE